MTQVNRWIFLVIATLIVGDIIRRVGFNDIIGVEAGVLLFLCLWYELQLYLSKEYKEK